MLYTTSDMFMNEYIGIAGMEKGKSAIDYSNNFKNKYRNVDVLIIDDIIIFGKNFLMNFHRHLYG